MMYDIKIAYGEKGLCDDSFDTTKIKLLDRNICNYQLPLILTALLHVAC